MIEWLKLITLSGAFFGVFIKAVEWVLRQAISKEFDLRNAKILEAIKLEHASVLAQIELRNAKLVEVSRLEHALLEQRYQTAIAACESLHVLVSDVATGLDQIEPTNGPELRNRILSRLHPEYRRRFQQIRARFEATNDVFSAYSLEIDRLLHPDSLSELFDTIDKPSPSNLRWAYRKAWITVSESLTALVRVCSNHQFWSPDNSYGDRAMAWAAFDRHRIHEFLKVCVSPAGRTLPGGFCLAIEEDGGTVRFWSEFPAWPPDAV